MSDDIDEITHIVRFTVRPIVHDCSTIEEMNAAIFAKAVELAGLAFRTFEPTTLSALVKEQLTLTLEEQKFLNGF